MPGYYDWKLLNCPLGAKAKADLLMHTVNSVDPYLEKIWKENGESFPPEVDAKLAAIVEDIDEAEACLEKAKHDLAEFFPGHPGDKDQRR